MNAKLKLHLRHGDDEIVLTKEFEIPFGPYPGLELMFVPIMNNHPDAAAFLEALASPVSVTGIFTVDSVIYCVEEGVPLVRVVEGCESIDMMEPMAKQLVIGYQFERDEDYDLE